MPRPEQPVEGPGPVPDLARELRGVRAGAGAPGYREMAVRARFSREALSAAARGAACPAWEVTKAFAGACGPAGAAARRLRPMWAAAGKRAGRRRPAAGPRPPAPGRRRRRRAAPGGRGPARPGGRPAPA
jgi:hypothetical protein